MKDGYLTWRVEVNLNRRIETLEKQAPSKEHKQPYESVADINRWIEELLKDNKKGTTKNTVQTDLNFLQRSVRDARK